MPRRGNRSKRKTPMPSSSIKDPPPKPATTPTTVVPATSTASKEQSQINPSELLLTIHSELTNLGKSLTCPLCLHTLSNPSLLPCIHAFCHKCITHHLSSSPNKKLCCPVCKVKCTKRSISPNNGAHLSDLVLGYKQALRAFGMVPIVYSETIEMTQIPKEQDGEKKEKGSSGERLKACHEHLEVSRTLHRILENAAVNAQEGKIIPTATTTTAKKTSASAIAPKSTRQTRSKTKKNAMTKSEELQHKNHVNKLQLLVSEQKKVVAVDERALIQAAVTKKKRSSIDRSKNKEEKNVEKEGMMEEDQDDFVSFDNVENNDENGDDDIHKDNVDKNYDKNRTSRENDPTPKDMNDKDTVNNSENLSEDKKDNDEIRKTSMIMMSSQEVYDISADDAREKEAADRSGEWILEEIEQEQEKRKKVQQQQQQEQKKKQAVVNVANDDGKKKRAAKRGRGRPRAEKDETKDEKGPDSSSAVTKSETRASKQSPSTAAPSTPDAATTTTTTISDTIQVGTIVQVQARTWPGVNKQGGVARVTNIHHSSSSNTTLYDVAYVLGGKEKNVDGAFVMVHKNEQETFASPVATKENDDEAGNKRSGRRSTRRSPRRSLSPRVEQEALSKKKGKRAKRVEPKKITETPTLPKSPTPSVSSTRRRPTRRAAAIAAAAVVSQTKKTTITRKGKENDVPPEGMAQIAQMEESSSSVTNKKKTTQKQEKIKVGKKRGLSKRSSNEGGGSTDIDNDHAAPSAKRMKKATTTALAKKKSIAVASTTATAPLTDQEKVQLADEWYKHVLFGSSLEEEDEESFPKGKVINIVTSSLSEYGKDVIRLFCTEMKRLGVTIKETKDFQPSKTTICITPAAAAPHSNNKKNTVQIIGVISKHRTLKAMRAALACIPIVTTDWVTACLEQKKIVPPKGDMCIRTLPTKLEHLLSCSGDDDVDASVPTARFGVSNYASIMCKHTMEKKGAAAAKGEKTQHEHLPLVNTAVFLSGSQWSKKGPKKSDVQILLKESGASILSSASMTTRVLKELRESNSTEKNGDSNDDNTRAVVILCDESTTDDGCGISSALLKELKKVIGLSSESSCGVLVVNTNWLFDCVSCGSLLGATDYEPDIPLAKTLWRLCMKK